MHLKKRNFHVIAQANILKCQGACRCTSKLLTGTDDIKLNLKNPCPHEILAPKKNDIQEFHKSR